jgi:hypothetical protein
MICAIKEYPKMMSDQNFKRYFVGSKSISVDLQRTRNSERDDFYFNLCCAFQFM